MRGEGYTSAFIFHGRGLHLRPVATGIDCLYTVLGEVGVWDSRVAGGFYRNQPSSLMYISSPLSDTLSLSLTM